MRNGEKHEQDDGVNYVANIACAPVYPVVTKRSESVADAPANEPVTVPLRTEIRTEQNRQMVENHQQYANASEEVDFPDSVAFMPRRESDLSVLCDKGIFLYGRLHKMNIALFLHTVNRRGLCARRR